jgi:ubiquinone/menaquinone biosynthesis C-methylase UbiE
MGAEYYDQIAQGYNELHGEEQKRKALTILDNLEVKPSDVLLDVGCGTAQYLSLFPCKKYGIDPAFELLKQAPVQVVQGRAEELPFPANSFDVVLSLTAIHNFDNPSKAVAEMVRVARRDIVISVLKKSNRITDIESAIKSGMQVRKRIEEQHDVIFFCRKSFI